VNIKGYEIRLFQFIEKLVLFILLLVGFSPRANRYDYDQFFALLNNSKL
jgi:hypothetical protein